MTQDEAQRIAAAYVASESEAAGVDLVLLEERTVEKAFGWVFFYDTKEFLRTGDDFVRAVGNAPFIVDRSSGKVAVAGTGRPIEDYLALYERFGTCHPTSS